MIKACQLTGLFSQLGSLMSLNLVLEVGEFAGSHTVN